VTPTASDIWNTIIEWAPLELAEKWDNCGLQSGHPLSPVQKVLLALDPSEALLHEAIRQKAQMVITHHPLIFQPLKSLDLSKYISRLVAGFLRFDITCYSAHTNLDSAQGGVADVLAAHLGLFNLKPLIPSATNKDAGLGRVGELTVSVSMDDIADKLARILNTKTVMITGAPETLVKTIALCPGSGSDLWEMAKKNGADLYITAEIKHHIAREALETGFLLIDAGHFKTEAVILPKIKDILLTASRARNWGIDVDIFQLENQPLSLFEDCKGVKSLKGVEIERRTQTTA